MGNLIGSIKQRHSLIFWYPMIFCHCANSFFFLLHWYYTWSLRQCSSACARGTSIQKARVSLFVLPSFNFDTANWIITVPRCHEVQVSRGPSTVPALQQTSINVSLYDYYYYMPLCVGMFWPFHILQLIRLHFEESFPCRFTDRLTRNTGTTLLFSQLSFTCPPTPLSSRSFRVSGTMEETRLITAKILSGKLQHFQGYLAWFYGSEPEGNFKCQA